MSSFEVRGVALKMSITGSFCLPLLQVNAAFVKNTSERGGSLHSVFRLCFLVCLFAGFLMGCSGAPFAALEDRAGNLPSMVILCGCGVTCV